MEHESRTGSLLIASGFLLFSQLVVPNIIAQTQLAWHRFGLADADFAAFVQKFLNKSIVGRFFGDMFHMDEPSVPNPPKQQMLCLSTTLLQKGPISYTFAL